MITDLTQMRPGESGVVVEIQGGWGIARRVHNLGIVAGKKITKLSQHFWRGPQTITIGNARIAIGFGMARRIIIEVPR